MVDERVRIRVDVDGDAEREFRDIGDAVDYLEEQARQADRAVDGLGDELDDASDRGGRFTGVMSGMRGAVAGVVAALGVQQLGAAITGRSRELEELSRIARVNVEDFQRLDEMNQRVGGSSEGLSDSLVELQRRKSEMVNLGTGPAVDALRLLGLSLEDVQDLNALEYFELVRDRQSELADTGDRLFVTDELLSGSSERLAGLLELEAGEYAKLRDAVEDQTVAQQENIEAINQTRRALGARYRDVLNRGINLLGGLASALGIVNTKAIEAAEGLDATVDEVEELGDAIGEEEPTGLTKRLINLGHFLDRISIPVLLGFSDAAKTTAESNAELAASVLKVQEAEHEFLEQRKRDQEGARQATEDSEEANRRYTASLAGLQSDARGMARIMDDHTIPALADVESATDDAGDSADEAADKFSNAAAGYAEVAAAALNAAAATAAFLLNEDLLLGQGPSAASLEAFARVQELQSGANFTTAADILQAVRTGGVTQTRESTRTGGTRDSRDPVEVDQAGEFEGERERVRQRYFSQGTRLYNLWLRAQAQTQTSTIASAISAAEDAQFQFDNATNTALLATAVSRAESAIFLLERALAAAGREANQPEPQQPGVQVHNLPGGGAVIIRGNEGVLVTPEGDRNPIQGLGLLGGQQQVILRVGDEEFDAHVERVSTNAVANG